MFIGAISMPGICKIFESGRGKMKPCVMSSVISCLSRSGLVVAPLWFPNSMACFKSCCRDSSVIGVRGQADPWVRRS